MANKIRIEWALELPQTGLKENSIYIIDPKTGVIPAVYVTNNTGSNAFRINPTTDLTSYLKFVNDISPNINGNIDLDLTYNNGVLSITGSDISFNLSADFVSVTTFNQYTTLTNNRLDSIEYAVTEGLKTPLPFNSTLYPIFPSKTKGTTYKVTVAGTTSDINLEIGDTIIYDTTGDNPFVIQANVDISTISVPGLIALASQQEVDEFLIDNKAITPVTFGTKLIRELKGPDGWNNIVLTDIIENTINMDGNKGKNFMITFDNLVIGNTCKIQKIKQNKVEASFWEGSEFWVKNNNTVGNLQFENTSLLPSYGTVEDITFDETIIVKPQSWVKMIVRNNLIYAINLSIENTDTLQSVTTRGNIISNKIRFTNNDEVNTTAGDFFFNTVTKNYSFGSLSQEATGTENVGVGFRSLMSLTTGIRNLSFGNNSLELLTTGGSNIAMGSYSGSRLTTETRNTFIGHNSGYASKGGSNTYFGALSGQGSQTGTNTSTYNTGIGVSSLVKINEGTNNTAVGVGSLYKLDNGRSNIGVGNYSGLNFVTGTANIFVGGSSGSACDTGNSNIYIGQSSASKKGSTQVVNSNRNIFIGRTSGGGVYGENNVFIGTGAGFIPGSGNLANINNKLIIHNRNPYTSGEDTETSMTNTENTFETGLITGDFAERWVKINGRLIVNRNSLNDADFDNTYTKEVVAKEDGTFGVQNRKNEQFLTKPQFEALTVIDPNTNYFIEKGT